MKYNIDHKFEYKKIEQSYLTDIEQTLNKYGSQGWQLVNFIFNEAAQQYIMILKRKYYGNE